jgi:simple sugar transport system substrate-binding protein
MIMRSKRLWLVVSIILTAALVLSACAAPTAAPTTAPATTEAPTAAPATTEAPTAAPEEKFVFGMLLVGPYNDNGWSTATYEGGLYVQAQIPNTEFIYADNVNIASNPNTTAAQFAEQLLQRGAKVIIFNSDDMKDGVSEFSKAHPDVPVIWLSGDYAWKDGQRYQADLTNESDIMGEMEYGKMMAGCAAALTTKTGKIGFLGPLINDETRRLADAAFLGAKYCWENIAKQTTPLEFKVTWIGMWFNIPGVTLDPTQVADDFYTNGYDVVISGIDSTEAVVEANKFQGQGKEVYAVQYDYKDACKVAPKACLGVPYFNWGVALKPMIQSIIDGTYTRQFVWQGPDWKDINNADTSMVGFQKSDGLSADASTKLDQFISELAGGLNLWTGPMNYQDGTVFLKEGETATPLQIWYMPQLLEGMLGDSVAK